MASSYYKRTDPDSNSFHDKYITSNSSFAKWKVQRADQESEETTRRAHQSYGFRKESYDNQYNDLVQNVGIGKKRGKEDFLYNKQERNREFGQIASRTFQRYMRYAPNAPTQFGLQNLAMRANSIQKSRTDFKAGRDYDRGVFDLNLKQTRGARDYSLNSRMNTANRDNQIKDGQMRAESAFKQYGNEASNNIVREGNRRASVATEQELRNRRGITLKQLKR